MCIPIAYKLDCAANKRQVVPFIPNSPKINDDMLPCPLCLSLQLLVEAYIHTELTVPTTIDILYCTSTKYIYRYTVLHYNSTKYIALFTHIINTIHNTLSSQTYHVLLKNISRYLPIASTRYTTHSLHTMHC